MAEMIVQGGHGVTLRLAEPGAMRATIERNDTPVGEVTAQWRDGDSRCWLEFGVTITNPALCGLGVGSAAAEAWVHHLFTTYPDIRRVGFTTWSDDERLIGLGRRLGLSEEARIREVRQVDGKWYDSLSFGVLRDEWAEIHAPQIGVGVLAETFAGDAALGHGIASLLGSGVLGLPMDADTATPPVTASPTPDTAKPATNSANPADYIDLFNQAHCSSDAARGATQAALIEYLKAHDLVGTDLDPYTTAVTRARPEWAATIQVLRLGDFHLAQLAGDGPPEGWGLV
ncbi:MAG: GNAT family N-acetyltransferase [Propionibacteriaceae bacterium]|jgi:hypothetical protein|nr:GNAT family N-acetyltransferase [Propionibacteriaceae bacterium]